MSILDDDLIDKIDDNILISKILTYYNGYGVYKSAENSRVIFEKPCDVTFIDMINEPTQYVLAVRYDYDHTHLTLLHINKQSRIYYKYKVTLMDILNYEHF